MSTFAVTLNYNCNYGFVEYNEASKTAAVTLPVEEAKAAVEKFLATPLTLDVPQGATIRVLGNDDVARVGNIVILTALSMGAGENDLILEVTAPVTAPARGHSQPRRWHQRVAG